MFKSDALLKGSEIKIVEKKIFLNVNNLLYLYIIKTNQRVDSGSAESSVPFQTIKTREAVWSIDREILPPSNPVLDWEAHPHPFAHFGIHTPPKPDSLINEPLQFQP
jgi:hypothetical protein